MEIIIKAAKANSPEIFNVATNEDNCILIRNLLVEERDKIISKLKNYKTAGLIGSIFYPRNKYLQKELNELVHKKRVLKKSIEQINKIF